jgi:transcription factor IIIB subunit 2
VQHYIDSAHRLFLLAVQRNFVQVRLRIVYHQHRSQVGVPWQGRKTSNVVAACLYIVCRREKSPHLLIDFSDVLQVSCYWERDVFLVDTQRLALIQTNVYVLGNCFLKFSRLLNLKLPIIDPSLYIHRFAAKVHDSFGRAPGVYLSLFQLEFHEKTHIVALSALRLVSRMKRDWMQVG